LGGSAEGPDGEPIAGQVVAKLNELLVELRERIKDRIAADKAVLEQILDAAA
jgi:hypothetical protein